MPNKPPPTVKQYDEEVEEVEEDEEEEEEAWARGAPDHEMHDGTIGGRAFHTPPDADMVSPSGPPLGPMDDGSDGGADDDDGLFAGGDDDSEGDEGMESVEVPEVPNANGIKRKLVEEDDYD